LNKLIFAVADVGYSNYTKIIGFEFEIID